MIPKILHYCWYGKKKLPSSAQDCINTWKARMPDYTIIEWNENNSPMSVPWVKNAYEAKSYAHVSDYVRLYALYSNGGIYLDVDVLVIKSFNDLLNNKFFAGFEDDYYINGAILGGVRDNLIFEKILNYYNNNKFTLLNAITFPRLFTKELKKAYPTLERNGNYSFDGASIFNTNYFYPIHYSQIERSNKWELVNENSYAVHLWEHSWKNEFWYLNDKKYIKGFSKAFIRLLTRPIQPSNYYRAILKYILYFLMGQKIAKKIKFLFKLK